MAAGQHGGQTALAPLPRLRLAGWPEIPVPSLLSQHAWQQRTVGAVRAHSEGGPGW